MKFPHETRKGKIVTDARFLNYIAWQYSENERNKKGSCIKHILGYKAEELISNYEHQYKREAKIQDLRLDKHGDLKNNVIMNAFSKNFLSQKRNATF